MSGLTFDWVDRAPDDPLVLRALAELARRFGPSRVHYRISSSGTGLHVLIGTYRFDRRTRSVSLTPAPMLPAQQFALRAEFGAEPWVDDDGPLECPGRFISDHSRAGAGLATSRIFGVKTDTDGSPAVCGPWRTWGDPVEEE